MHPQLFAERLTILLDAAHRRGEPTPTADEVARQVSIHTRQVVPVGTVDQALRGESIPSDEIVSGIAETFRAPHDLFTDTAAGVEMAARLRACAEIRDRYCEEGMNVIARGTTLGETQVSELMEFFSAHADDHAG